MGKKATGWSCADWKRVIKDSTLKDKANSEKETAFLLNPKPPKPIVNSYIALQARYCCILLYHSPF